MVPAVKDKVALVTGAASGIGLNMVQELLRNGAKAVTLADIDPNLGKLALDEIEKEFGSTRTLFVKTDVSDINEFEDAFIKTIEASNNIDILINNAGILNERTWEKMIATNLTGTINGILLGFEKYLPEYRQGPEAFIVNIACIDGINICPGITLTPLVTNFSKSYFRDGYESCLQISMDMFPPQERTHVAQETVKLIESSPNGTIWVIEGRKPAYQHILQKTS